MTYGEAIIEPYTMTNVLFQKGISFKHNLEFYIVLIMTMGNSARVGNCGSGTTM